MEERTVEIARQRLRRAIYEAIAGLYQTPENSGPSAVVADCINDLIEAHLVEFKTDGPSQ